MLYDRVVMPDLNSGFAVWDDDGVTVPQDLPCVCF
jgi:hypothetical protein